MQPSEIEILFVSHKYPPTVGGMEKQSFELINGVAHYLKVHTLLYTGGENILRFFFLLNRRIMEKIKAHPRIRVIHFNDGLIASLATFHTGYAHLKKVVTIHGLDIVFPLPYFKRHIVPRFNTFERVIAVSEATADAARSAGIDPSRVTVIPNGVDPVSHQNERPTTILPDVPYFITLGRPVKRKGFSWLMKEVVPFVKGDFKLLMLGPFDSKPRWKERLLSFLPSSLFQLITLFLGYPTDQQAIRKLLQAHPDKVQHLGKVPTEELMRLLAQAEAFLMPNIKVAGDMEGFGLVCLEASTAGALVVAAELEGITSAICKDKNGILLPSQDAAAWICQLQAILDSPDRHRQLGAAFREYTLKHYSWDIMARSYSQEFIDLCAETDSHRPLSAALQVQ